MLKMRWLNASVDFICSMTGSSERLDLSTPGEPLPVRPLRRSRLSREAPGRVYDPRGFYYNYACLLYYYMYMMKLAQVSTTPTTTAAPQAPATTAIPLEYDGQMPGHYDPHYYLVGKNPVFFPPPFAFDATASAGQGPHGSWNPLGKWPPGGPSHPGFLGSSWPLQQVHQYYGGYPYQVLPQTAVGDEPFAPAEQHTSPAPAPTTAAPATATPCPSRVRPIGASCLGVVNSYIPYENLTFQPYVSYEAAKPAKAPRGKTEQRSEFNVGVQPRAHPYSWADALPGHYHKWPGHRYWYHYHQPEDIPVYTVTSSWPGAKNRGKRDVLHLFKRHLEVA